MSIYLILIIVFLAALLFLSYRRNKTILCEMKQLVGVREAALDIANRVVKTNNSADLYQYILESCLRLIPKAKFGSILMFNTDGLLVAKASVGFNLDEINNFRLPLEESFLYYATDGKLDKTVIINRLEDLILEKNIVSLEDVKGFALRSEVSSPMYVNNELVGMLCIDGDENDIFTYQDIYVLDYMANQISIVINNQKLYEEIFHLSRYDSLSNLLNRNSFEREADKLLDSASADTDKMHFVSIDFDDLKLANDTFGHNYGDEMIRWFSILIKAKLGDTDICGRYGGDEFVAIFQCDHDILVKKLEEMKEAFMYSQNLYKEGGFTPDFSYGIASFKEGNGSLDSLYKLADARMYEVKNSKKKVS